MKDKDLMSLMFSDAAEFRQQVLGKTLRRARSRRRVRLWGQALVAIALLASAIWWTLPRPATPDAPVAAGLSVVHSDPSTVEVVSTSSAGLQIVGDDELLSMVPGETKFLVWHGAGDAELVIFGP